MEEVLPGLFHWTALHPRIGQPVSSYYVEPHGILIDPMVPDEGLDRFEGARQILLTNRHHLRQGERFVERFACRVRCNAAGLHEFEGGPDVEGFEVGGEIAPGVHAVEIGVLCPDETALEIAIEDHAVALADCLIRLDDGELSFVPDGLLGDDPQAVKSGLLDAFRKLLERDFNHLLFAHGEPLIGGAKAALAEFVASAGRDGEGADARRTTDRLEREVGELERRAAEVGDAVEEARTKWESKRADPKVPGAQPEP
jgi:hypothetical protein